MCTPLLTETQGAVAAMSYLGAALIWLFAWQRTVHYKWNTIVSAAVQSCRNVPLPHNCVGVACARIHVIRGLAERLNHSHLIVIARASTRAGL